jgi:hypothetical protein
MHDCNCSCASFILLEGQSVALHLVLRLGTSSRLNRSRLGASRGGSRLLVVITLASNVRIANRDCKRTMKE